MAATEPRPAGHEPDRVETKGIVGFLVALAIMVAASCALVWGVFRLLAHDARSEDRPLPGNVAQVLKRLPPAPRLEDRPLVLRTMLNAQEHARLSTYGWVDRATGVVHVPIDRAIDLLAERGIPATASAPALPAPVGAAAPVKPLPPGGTR